MGTVHLGGHGGFPREKDEPIVVLSMLRVHREIEVRVCSIAICVGGP